MRRKSFFPPSLLLRLNYIHIPALPFFSPRKTISVTLEGSQSPLAPSFVTLQTSEEQARFEELVRRSVLENCHVVLCLLYNYDLSYNQAKDIFPLPGKWHFHIIPDTQSHTVMKRLLRLDNCGNAEALDDLK